MFDYSQPASFQWNELKKIFSMKNYSLAIALISFILSICALVASCRIEPFHVGIESVMGIVTALMGICATFMVGWQIYNSIKVDAEIKRLNRLNEESKKNIAEFELLIKDQKKEMEKEKENRVLLSEAVEAQICIAKGYAFIHIQYFSSYLYFATALYHFILTNQHKEALKVLHNMGVTMNSAKKKLYFLMQEVDNGKTELDKEELKKIRYAKSNSLNKENSPIEKIKRNVNYSLYEATLTELEEVREEITRKAKELPGYK